MKEYPPKHYYYATARLIQDKYYYSLKLYVRMPSEIDSDVEAGKNKVYNAIIDCIKRALITHVRIHVPREACRLFFENYAVKMDD